MKVLVVSDTHKKNDAYFEVLRREQPDMVIHCGDAEGSEYALTQAADCPVHIVLGNNDFFSHLPRELELEIGPYKVWATHGHTYFVYMDNEYLKQEAKARGVDVVLYGHTHRPVIDKKGGVIAVNPGSLSYPRQANHRPSYALMELDGKERLHFRIVYL